MENFPQLSFPVQLEFPNKTQTLLYMEVCYCDQLLENTTFQVPFPKVSNFVITEKSCK